MLDIIINKIKTSFSTYKISGGFSFELADIMKQTSQGKNWIFVNYIGQVVESKFTNSDFETKTKIEIYINSDGDILAKTKILQDLLKSYEFTLSSQKYKMVFVAQIPEGKFLHNTTTQKTFSQIWEVM